MGFPTYSERRLLDVAWLDDMFEEAPSSFAAPVWDSVVDPHPGEETFRSEDFEPIDRPMRCSHTALLSSATMWSVGCGGRIGFFMKTDCPPQV